MTWSVHLISLPCTVSARDCAGDPSGGAAVGRDDPASRERLSEFLVSSVAVVLAVEAKGDDGRSSVEEVPAQKNV